MATVVGVPSVISLVLHRGMRVDIVARPVGISFDVGPVHARQLGIEIAETAARTMVASGALMMRVTVGSGHSSPREQCGSAARGILLEPICSLILPYECRDGDDVLVAETLHGWHVSEGPVVLLAAEPNGLLKREIRVVPWLVDC